VRSVSQRARAIPTVWSSTASTIPPRAEIVEYPHWFTQSFLDLDEDLASAVAAGKKGLMVYFGQRRCAYCHKLMKVNFGMPDIVEYTKRHFEVVPIDIWGVAEVTDVDGATLTERDIALKHKTNFTPSIVFFGEKGKEILRVDSVVGFYRLRNVLNYISSKAYLAEPDYQRWRMTRAF
jgi:thioredoxin-related protein